MQLQPAEVEALESSAGLLKYAAERPVQLPQDLVAAITTAWMAHEENAWTPQTATTFWGAYNELYRLVQPVNLHSIAANEQSPRSRVQSFFGLSASLSRRTAQIYTSWLMVLLILATFLGLLGS